MPDTTAEPGSFQWKWVWITLGMFAVLYFLPIVGASILRGEFGTKIIGGWSFGGILFIAALSGYLSRGVTIWEPAVAGGLLTVLWYGTFHLLAEMKGMPLGLDASRIVLITVAVFGLSLVGAGLGEGIQNAVKRGAETKANKNAPSS
jgi:hypothetical protein